MSSARRLFTKREVLDLHREVLAVVAELDPPPELVLAVYGSVVAMIGQHQVIQPVLGGVPLPGRNAAF